MPGRKKAVVIGINYSGTDCDLRGAVNDALSWTKELAYHGFERSSVLTMIDEYPNGESLEDDDENYSLPTKEGIMEALDWLVTDALEGDNLVFVFCGHGAQVPEVLGSNDEKLEEALCPCDWDEFEWGIVPYRLINDEMLHQYFSRLPSGVLLTVVIDASLSNAPMRVPLRVNTEFPHREVENSPVTQAMYGKFRYNCNAWLNSQHVNATARRLPCEPQRPLWSHLAKLLNRDEAPPLNEGLAVFCITASSKAQSALEAWLEGQQRGILSYCLLQALEHRQHQSCHYLDWMDSAQEVADVLRSQVLPYMDQYFHISYCKNAAPDECKIFESGSAFVAQDRAKRRRGQKHRPA